MYLRCNRRFKDGKEHCYWNIAEAKRCADGRVVQRQVLYIGEINDSQHEAWCRVIEVFDEDTRRRTQLALFPAEREVPEHAKAYSVQVRLDAMQLHRPRQWGACWLACRLYEQLGLDTSGKHACRIVEKAPVGDTSCRHWWFTACSIPAGVEKVIRALCHLRDTHPRKRKLSTELAYFRRHRHRMRDLLVSKGEAGDPRAVGIDRSLDAAVSHHRWAPPAACSPSITSSITGSKLRTVPVREALLLDRLRCASGPRRRNRGHAPD